MVYTMPYDFVAQNGQPDQLEGDVNDESEPMVLVMDEVQSPKPEVRIISVDYNDQKTAIVFKKPTAVMAKHLKPLYVKAHFNGVPISRVLVCRTAIEKIGF